MKASESSASNLLQKKLMHFIRPLFAVSPRELGIFCEEVSVMYGAGVELVTCLEILGPDGKNKFFSEDIQNVKKRVQQGASLSEATAASPDSFPPLFISMIQAGELGGSLDQIFKNLGDYYHSQAALKSKLFHTLLYPVIVLIIAVLVVLFLLTSVIPIFVNIFNAMDAKIPLVTQILMDVSAGVTKGLPFFIILIVLLFCFFKRLPAESTFRYQCDRLLLKLPAVGKMIYYVESLRFADALGILLSNGIELMTALKVVENTIGNRYIRTEFSHVRLAVRQGSPFAESLKATGIIEADFYQMVRVGEQSGALDRSLKTIAAFYKEESDRRLKTMMTIIEPAILVIVGLFVMFIVLSIMTPIYEIYQGYANILN